MQEYVETREPVNRFSTSAEQQQVMQRTADNCKPYILLLDSTSFSA